jgi:two-component system phosphate regulon sensor histidine kinase PhoR
VWNEVKTNLKSSLVFFKEYLLFVLVLIIVYFLLNKLVIGIIPIFIILLALSIIIMYQIGKKRNIELAEIKSIISDIRSGKFSYTDEIKLSPNLHSLEKEIKKMYRRVQKDISHLERLQKMRSQFIANVSHELRTPIFTIQGFIETLLDGAVNDSQVNKQFLQKANQHTIALSNLLNDLIDLSMIESGELRMSYRYFEANNYLIEIVEELFPLADENGLELIFNPVREGLEIFGDREKLKQVFVNIIQNAIKYTEKGKVEIVVEELKKSVRFTIKDTGIGIPEQSIRRIFERFYRVDKARSKSVGGTGLGLAIVRHILEAHNSTIGVRSVPDGGTDFYFELEKLEHRI